ncbi:MAG TPA: NADH-quinone oxidoreductase subunit C [Vampirovibrionales bacterium]
MTEEKKTPEKTVTPKATVKKVVIPKAKFGEVAKQIKDRFSCSPEPLIGGNTESFLLEDSSCLINLMNVLKDEFSYEVLLLINAVEYKNDFQLIYQLQCLAPYKNLAVKVNIKKNKPEIESLTSLWESANWYEREIWDLHGIVFNNHPKLTRILNPDQWNGHPMLKNYIQPLDSLNGPITAVKGSSLSSLQKSERSDVEVIEEIVEESAT